MKILLFSDSHGNINNMVKAIRKHQDVDMIIHLGDMVRDIKVIENTFIDFQFEYIRGNNDWDYNVADYKILEIESKKIYITHGHIHNVKSDYSRIVKFGNSMKLDALFFGHTHEPEEFFSDGMMLLNPGSIAGGRYSLRSTYCLIEISDGKIRSRFEGFK